MLAIFRKHTGPFYDGQINSDFTEIKIDAERGALGDKEGYISFAHYCRMKKIPNSERNNILSSLGLKRLYILYDEAELGPLKKPKKKKRVNLKKTDPFKIDKEVMLKWGPDYAKQCLRCNKECKELAKEHLFCDEYEILEGSYFYLRKYNHNFHKIWGPRLISTWYPQMNKFMRNFYKNTNDPYWT